MDSIQYILKISSVENEMVGELQQLRYNNDEYGKMGVSGWGWYEGHNNIELNNVAIPGRIGGT